MKHLAVLIRTILSLTLALTAASLPGSSSPSADGEPGAGIIQNEPVDFSKVVVPISSFKIVPGVKIGFTGKIGPKLGERGGYGTGFCLDAICRFIVTNYHVAKPTSARKIRHQRIKQRYFATGPEDHEATVRFISGFGVLPYAAKRDLALLELREPIHGYHGMEYSLDDLQPRQQVDIYSFPYESNPFRGLTHVTARFNARTTSGLLAFDCAPSEDDHQIHVAGGSSGGIVVDHRTQKIVGVLSELNGTMAFAVPVTALVDFVSKVQPFVAVKTFPAFKNLGPDSVDIYPQFEPPPDFNTQFKPTHSGVLEHRAVEPDNVVLLREKAQQLADNMQNFIAVQSIEWGHGDKEPEYHAQYEVRVIDGNQKFRYFPDGKRDLRRMPLPRGSSSGWAMGSDEWATEPKMVGTEFGLKISRAPDTEYNGRKVSVFQYAASIEDDACIFQPLTDYGLFVVGSPFPVACYGEVWTDENSNIIRISETLDLSKKLKKYKKWDEYRTVLTYDWVKIEDEPARLLPITFFLEGENGKKLYWCRGTFSNYRMFASHSRLLGPPDEGSR